MSEPAIAAIVVTYRTGPRLKDCLHALADQQSLAELIIVDNGNPDLMTEWLENFSTGAGKVRYIQTGENLGFGRAVNLGAGLALSEQLLVINPDCVIRPDAIAPLQAAAQNGLLPWIIGGRLFDLKGRAQYGPQRRELTLPRMFSKLMGGPGINMPLQPQPDGPCPVDVISGAFFLTDREGFQALGGFDEAYFLHVEDIDLCKRAGMAGGSVIYQPLAGALHVGATSNVSSLFVERHKAAGFARYFRTHSRGLFRRLLVEAFIPLMYMALMLRACFGGLIKPD